LVVLHHVALRIPLKDGVFASFFPAWVINTLTRNGYEAVFIFFVISGFLITSNALDRWGRLDAVDIRVFYGQRIARILPCLVALIFFLSVLHMAGIKGYAITHSNQSLPRAIVSAMGMHLNWYEGRTGWLPGSWDVLWSLSIEELFYLCFPIVCRFLRREWCLITALGVFALSLPAFRILSAGNEIWQEKAYLPGMSAIAMGIVGALAASRIRSYKRWWGGLLSAFGGSGLFAVLCFENQIWPRIGNGTILLLTISAACLILAFHLKPSCLSAVKMPGIGWLCSFGRLSYEVYLTHMFIVFSVAHVANIVGKDSWWAIIWYLPVISLSWIVGGMVERYYSIPMKQVLYRMFFPKCSADHSNI
jgi:peptidoglycan/LPS O-acetylase OafA/YrhL